MADLFIRIQSKRLQRLGRELFWIGAGQAVATVGALVGVRLLTSVLSPDIYGELVLGVTLAVLIDQTLLGPLSNAALRFFSPAKESNEFASFLVALRRLLIKATGVGLLLGGILYTIALVIGSSNWYWLGVASTVFALLSGYNAALSNMQNAARQRAVVAWHQALASWGRFLLAVVFVLWFGATSAIAMAGYLIANLFVLLSQSWFFRRTVLSKDDSLVPDVNSVRRWESQMVMYAWPFATWGLFTWGQLASDRWALQLSASAQEVGLYAVLYQLGYYPVTVVTTLVMNLVAPIFFEHAGDGSEPSRVRHVYSLNWRLTKITLALTVSFTLLSFPLHKAVFQIFAAEDYRAVSWLLPGMVLAGGLFASGQFVSIDLLADAKSRSLLLPKIVTALIGVILNLAGAALFGIPGVVAAAILFSASYFAWVTISVTRNS